MDSKPIVLFVDDEPAMLDGLQLAAGRRYDVKVATSGKQGLELLGRLPDTAIVVSDMRMPEMDGATFLTKVKDSSPDAVRLLLTGYADIDAASRAVNEGRVFRFLAKPCPPEQLLAALAAAHEMHRLIVAERVLLQKTLVGSVKAVVNVLGLTNPAALGRAVRVRERSRQAAEKLKIENRWSVEFAALFSQLAAAGLPDETAQKLYRGERLSSVEQRELLGSTESMQRILTEIPRLDPVADILGELIELTRSHVSSEGNHGRHSPDAKLLHAIIDLEVQEAQGLSPRQAIEALKANESRYGSETLSALSDLIEDSEHVDIAVCSPEQLTDGMVLAEELCTVDGLLLLPRGFELTRSSRDHIVCRFKDRLPRKIAVRMPSSDRPPMPRTAKG